ncbi:hypothetical protein EX30DRAFT_373977 [Ascodesmis nigricans]|uniref:SH3 domain-containing protein n=1 Tax=Ascodesmis nigricans TaxID=341454 RepID=A0A4S2MMH3_9PEZI|nr:hypothetical protein EX30DRAFT_373977 [Ascodesmis nigricans]
MAKRFHRQMGKLASNRAADEASVAMLIKEVDDTDQLLLKFSENTKNWRDAWSAILLTESNLADAYWSLYQPIPRSGATESHKKPPEDTPLEVFDRVKELQNVYGGLKNDMMGEVQRVEKLVVAPLAQCVQMMKPVRKALERRENKKLDFERFNRNAEQARAKLNKTDAQHAATSRAESDLERALSAYESADEYIKSFVPPILQKIAEFIPLLLEIVAEVQFKLLQHLYSDFHYYSEQFGLPEAQEEDVIVAEWEASFLGLQQEVESGLSIIAHGKARHVPMNMLGRDQGIVAKHMPNIPGMGRGGKKMPPPPPPPPSSGTSHHSQYQNHHDENTSRLGFNRQKSTISLSSPSIRSRKSTSSLHRDAHERDESPPPPLPGPRPTIPAARPSSSYSTTSHGSGSTATGYVTPTPLAGMRPSTLKGTPSPSSISSSSSAAAAAAASSYLSRPNNNHYPQNLEVRDHYPRPVTSTSPTPHKIGSTLRASSSNTNLRLPYPNSPSPSASPYSSSPTPSFATLAAAKKKPPPPPPPKKKHLQPRPPPEDWVTALYDFAGEAQGDLAFNEGERIRVTRRTESRDEWWDGEVLRDGKWRRGSFPANYCQ